MEHMSPAAKLELFSALNISNQTYLVMTVSHALHIEQWNYWKYVIRSKKLKILVVTNVLWLHLLNLKSCKN